jgi:multicomponent Na+:H+ antiporter subunit D
VLALYMVGAVSISSVPLFSGFVSKELGVEAAYRSDLVWLVLLLKVASVGTFLHTGLKLPHGAFIGREGLGPATNDGHRITVGPVPVSMYVAMGIGAVANLVIGLFPALLYDLLPHAVDYTPYSFAKILEKSQILLFTALAFWLLLDRLHAKAKVSLDTDWAYRALPLLVGGTRPAVVSDDVPGDGVLLGVQRRVTALVAPRPSAVVPTWTLGGIILLAALIVLVVSLTP